MSDDIARITIVFDGPTARHNMPCPICQSRKAVYNLNDGIFKPCWKCQETWETRRKPWWRRGAK